MTDLVITKLEWDEINITHIALHNIMSTEVEELAGSNDFCAYKSRNNRIVLIGKTQNNRTLKIVLEPIDEKQELWRPITAHDASRKERKLYQVYKKGGE